MNLIVLPRIHITCCWVSTSNRLCCWLITKILLFKVLAHFKLKIRVRLVKPDGGSPRLVTCNLRIVEENNTNHALLEQIDCLGTLEVSTHGVPSRKNQCTLLSSNIETWRNYTNTLETSPYRSMHRFSPHPLSAPHPASAYINASDYSPTNLQQVVQHNTSKVDRSKVASK